MQTTRWSPDTCTTPKCVIEYTWDSTVDPSLRVHTPSAILQQCSLHAGLSLAAHWAALQDENPRKNKILATAKAQFSLTDDQVSSISWFYDANHVLNVSIPFFSAQQKSTIQTWANNNIGTGKVLVS